MKVYCFNRPYWLLPIFLLGLFTVYSSCEKFVEATPPKTELVKSTVFESDALARSAMLGVYSAMITNGYSAGGVDGISICAAMSADEMVSTNSNSEFNVNDILPSNNALASFWSQPYNHIYRANDIIEGLSASKGVTLETKKQLLGEALFIRAFTYFYLVNLFGDVPLVLTTDYRINALISRTPKDKVYEQIVLDLKEAESLLSSDYSFSKGERTIPNKWTAKALMARVYLFLKKYEDAELVATEVIENTTLYDTVAVDLVFLKNSKEAIWQLSRDNGNSRDAITFKFTGAPVNGSLRKSVVSLFDATDLRLKRWIGSTINGGVEYFYPDKYKSTLLSPITEYATVFRIGELYLIRAECRIHNQKIADGIADLNVIRIRASPSPPNNLSLIPGDLTKAEAISVLEEERFRELFSEWGHRWLDLKRWPSSMFPGDFSLSRADDVLPVLKPGWTKEDKLYPIPKVQLDNSPGMANQQNPGYF